MEALASGLPCLATPVGGVHELVLEGRNGFTVPSNDPDALAEKLAVLVTQPEKWPEWGGAGRAHIMQNYDVNVLNDRLVSLFETLVAS
jgi:colanic acid/amylovoran biosynthesis glycosyltransferase